MKSRVLNQVREATIYSIDHRRLILDIINAERDRLRKQVLDMGEKLNSIQLKNTPQHGSALNNEAEVAAVQKKLHSVQEELDCVLSTCNELETKNANLNREGTYLCRLI